MANRILSLLCAGGVALVLSAAAQEIQFLEPVSGLVYDPPSQSLRRVLGMPGSAILGAPLISDVEWATVSPDSKRAVLVRGGETRIIARLGVSDETQVTGAVDRPSLAAWSADSRAVLLYSETGRSLQWLRFDDWSAVSSEQTPLVDLEGAVTGIAGNFGHSSALLAVSGVGVYRVQGGAVTLVYPSADVAGVSVSAKDQTAWVADRAGSRLVEVAGLAGEAPEVKVLLEDGERLGGMSALAISSDEALLFLACSSSRQLFAFDRAAAALSEPVELESETNSIAAFGKPSVFLLGFRKDTQSPIYLMAEGARPSIFFVPAGEVR